MATNFPTGSDNFNIPNSPGTTALSSSGTGSRNHVQHHRDIGDAIEAMEAESTLAIHSHDGSTARHGNKLPQSSTHQSPDTNLTDGSLHRTLGHGANQAAPGNHAGLAEFQDTHASSVSWPVGSIFLSTSATNPGGVLGGTWVQIQDAFLVGVGASYPFTGSVVANSSTHTHSIGNTSSDGSHSHSFSSPLSTNSSHTHTSPGTGSTSNSHTHSTNSGTIASSGAVDSGFGNNAGGTASHTHGTTSSGGGSHSHTASSWDAAGSHSHTMGTVSGSTHSHSVTSSAVNHMPTWKSFYVWRRTV